MMHVSNHLELRGGVPLRCNKNGKCCYGYPHAPRPYTQLNAKQHVDYCRTDANAWVVPYNPALLLLWEGHINIEAVFTVDVFLYIYKYLFKGRTYVLPSVTHTDQTNNIWFQVLIMQRCGFKMLHTTTTMILLMTSFELAIFRLMRPHGESTASTSHTNLRQLHVSAYMKKQ
jgi:hypothetical protein